MSIKEFFRTIQWQATLQVALIRVVIASLLWPILFIIFGTTQATEYVALVFGFFLFLLASLAVAIPVIGLSRAGVPYVGLLAFPAWLVVIANPIVMLLHSKKPEWVPVDEFELASPPVLAVFGSGDELGSV